jgi:diguanylate cyclase (GGDEF)-like protein
MPESQTRLPLVDLRADDLEIEHYAALLDSLGIGLLAFAADGSVHLRNTRASDLLGDTPTIWEDENGQPLTDDQRLEVQVLHTRKAVHQRAMGIRNQSSSTHTWCKGSAFPVFSNDGKLRRVLLILADLRQHGRMAGDSQQLPTHDPLTKVFNQRYITLLLDDEVHRARRYGTPFALALIAIDRFGDFSRANTIPAEPPVLARVGRLMCKSVREFDMIGRFGSDQFLVILPNVRVNDAMIGLERLRELVEASNASDAEPRLTISGGVSEYTGEDAPALIESVASLLTTAREAGCNRLCVNMDIF